MADPYAKQPSPTKNLTGGAGCGCGCLGLLLMLGASLLLLGIPLDFYEESDINVFMWSAIGAGVTGATAALVGIGAYIGSLFLD